MEGARRGCRELGVNTNYGGRLDHNLTATSNQKVEFSVSTTYHSRNHRRLSSHPAFPLPVPTPSTLHPRRAPYTPGRAPYTHAEHPYHHAPQPRGLRTTTFTRHQFNRRYKPHFPGGFFRCFGFYVPSGAPNDHMTWATSTFTHDTNYLCDSIETHISQFSDLSSCIHTHACDAVCEISFARSRAYKI